MIGKLDYPLYKIDLNDEIWWIGSLDNHENATSTFFLVTTTGGKKWEKLEYLQWEGEFWDEIWYVFSFAERVVGLEKIFFKNKFKYKLLYISSRQPYANIITFYILCSRFPCDVPIQRVILFICKFTYKWREAWLTMT